MIEFEDGSLVKNFLLDFYKNVSYNVINIPILYERFKESKPNPEINEIIEGINKSYNEGIKMTGYLFVNKIILIKQDTSNNLKFLINANQNRIPIILETLVKMYNEKTE